MESEIKFYFLGDYDQAMGAALKLIPKTAKDREIKIVLVSGSNYNQPTKHRVSVKFVNEHVYAVVTEAADIFDNEPMER
jgi:uncharacterized protein YaiI (UPF0178 family)